MPAVASILLFATVFAAPETVLDRIAVIVGKQVIKTSDIQRAIRLTEFLNREPLNFSEKHKREAAERLIDQQIIRSEIASQGYSRATDSEAGQMLGQIRQSRFGNSSSRLNAALAQYGLTTEELREQLLWQLTVLRFIQQRFQPDSSVSGEAANKALDEWLAGTRRQIRIEYREGAFQ